jgi:putative hydrolase of the HAD superfamily
LNNINTFEKLLEKIILMKQYKHIFFDLDKTLWDFTANNKDTFIDLFEQFKLESKGVKSPEFFQQKYNVHNDILWDLYRKGKVGKSFLSVERFRLTLNDFGIIDNLLAADISCEYVRLSPLKTKLIPGTIETLEYLFPKYQLHIITNGFKEVQYIKVERSGLAKYFQQIITSEEAGCNKPNIQIFLYALEKTSANASECLMIGDDLEVDVQGAKDAGMDQVFVNLENCIHNKSINYEVKSLLELKNFL